MFICIGILKYAKHWWLSLFRYETLSPRVEKPKSQEGNTFITFLTLRFFDTGRERDTASTMLTVPSDPTTRGYPVVHNWTGLAQVQISTRFVEPQISTHCFFSKITQNSQSIASGHDVIHVPSPISIRGYYDICDCHILPAQAWTPALNVCPYPCTKPNSSKPN